MCKKPQYRFRARSKVEPLRRMGEKSPKREDDNKSPLRTDKRPNRVGGSPPNPKTHSPSCQNPTVVSERQTWTSAVRPLNPSPKNPLTDVGP